MLFRFLGRRALPAFARALPAISRTEQEALAAGTVGFEGELVRGAPDWQAACARHEPRLTAEEQRFLDIEVPALCELVDEWDVHQRQDLPPAAWARMKSAGFFGLAIPVEYGGKGFSPYAHAEIVSRLATRSGVLAITAMVPNSLGPAELLLHYGTDEQKARLLPRLACGMDIPCFALTSPDAGSDAASIPDVGVVCEEMWEGRPTLGFRVSFSKRYITLAPVATLAGLAFRVRDPLRLLPGGATPGITCALVPLPHPGVSVGLRHQPMGIGFMNGPLWGHEVFIPADWVIGGPARIGQGWRMLMESLAIGRGVSLPALAGAVGRTTTAVTSAYARIREQFGLPVGSFEGVAEKLADIAGRTYRMESARRFMLGALNAGEAPVVASAIVKLHLTEDARRVVNAGMDVLAGKGICMGPANPLAQVYQALPIAITVEGANILTRGLIVFGQGVVRCHPWLPELMACAHSHAQDQPDPQLETRFGRALIAYTGHVLRRVLGLFMPRRAPTWAGRRTAPLYRRIGELANSLALATELALVVHGPSLKRRELDSARLGDVLSHLYLAHACLKRFERDGEPVGQERLLAWAVRDSLDEATRALAAFAANLPRGPAGGMAALLVRLTGKGLGPPDDRLSQSVGLSVQQDGAVREALVHPSSFGAAVAGIEAAWRAVLREGELFAKEKLERKGATVTLDDVERAKLAQVRAQVREVVAVDAFEFDSTRAAYGEARRQAALAR